MGYFLTTDSTIFLFAQTEKDSASPFICNKNESLNFKVLSRPFKNTLINFFLKQNLKNLDSSKSLSPFVLNCPLNYDCDCLIHILNKP